VGQDVKLTASDGFKLGGYRADPAGSPNAAVVVIQEIFGVNHHIRSVCDRLAGAGYVAIAPSIFDRVEPNFQTGYSPDEVANARKFVANPDWAAMLLDTQAAIDAVKVLPRRQCRLSGGDQTIRPLRRGRLLWRRHRPLRR
jgi:carboxymethylenebutenolidase